MTKDADSLTIKLKEQDTPYTKFTWSVLGASIHNYIKSHPTRKLESIAICVKEVEGQRVAHIQLNTKERTTNEQQRQHSTERTASDDQEPSTRSIQSA